MSATLGAHPRSAATNDPRIDIDGAPADLTDPVTATEEMLGAPGARHRRRSRLARVQWVETVALLAAVLTVVLLTRSPGPSGAARHAAVAPAADHVTTKGRVRPAEVDLYAANVLGTNSRAQIGTYDRRGRWHPYRGYVTPTEAQNLLLVHLHGPAATRTAHRTPRTGGARPADHSR